VSLTWFNIVTRKNIFKKYQLQIFMMKKKPTLQAFIFDKLQSHFKKTSDVVSALSNLFNLHPDGVYRRIRGESELRPDEIEIIASEYKISLDAHIFKNSDSVLFQFNPLIKTIKNFDDYTTELYNAVKPLSDLKGLTLYSASSDLPIFYFLSSPELFSFKMFVLAQSVWNFEYIKQEKFSFNILSRSTQARTQQIWHIYRMQNTIEMWSLNILDSTINQIEYYFSIKIIKSKTDALKLCTALFDLVSNLENMATEGKRITDKSVAKDSFKLYHNELNFANNTILIESEMINLVYTNFVIPDYLRTTDTRIVKHTQNWFSDIISKSTQISTQGEKSRKYFFETLFIKIADLKLRIEKG